MVIQMNWIKIKDNQYIYNDKLSDVKEIVDRVTDKTLEQLESEGIFVFPEFLKDIKDMTKEQTILKSCNDGYISGNVMGYIGISGKYLAIESRFSLGDNDYFFQYLLDKVLDFPNFIDLSTSIIRNKKMLTLLLFMFPYYLKRALRKGIFKTYICNKYSDKNIKGKIDIAGHIRKNIPFKGDIAYIQREYSFDNYLTELIRHTVEYIKSKSYGYKLLNKVKEEVRIITDATLRYNYGKRQAIIDENNKNIIRHAYYYEYRELQKLCVLILKMSRHRFYFGSQKMYGILFDGAWLFEEYINLLIGNKFYHPMNKRTGGQYLFSRNVGAIYPDFIGKDTNNRIIADAKYKPLDKIRDKDFLQLLAYMFRFDAKKGMFLYPEPGDKEAVSLYLNSGLTYENNVLKSDIKVIKHGLKIPKDAIDYPDFVEKIRHAEDEFIKCIG